MANMKTAAKILHKKGWDVGEVLRAREEMRNDLYFEVTAIGREKVLGCRILEGGKLGKEIDLPLTDPFIEWKEVKRAGAGFTE